MVNWALTNPISNCYPYQSLGPSELSYKGWWLKSPPEDPRTSSEVIYGVYVNRCDWVFPTCRLQLWWFLLPLFPWHSWNYHNVICHFSDKVTKALTLAVCSQLHAINQVIKFKRTLLHYLTANINNPLLHCERSSCKRLDTIIIFFFKWLISLSEFEPLGKSVLFIFKLEEGSSRS